MLKHKLNMASGEEFTRIKVPLSDGTLMTCRVDGSGPTIFLVHGWAVDHSLFNDLAAILAKQYRVIAPDLRGHGETATGDRDVSIDLLADDLEQMFDHFDCEPVLALGWSMGAMALWRMIQRHGHGRLSGLIVEDMSPRILNDTSWALGMANGLDARASERLEGSMRTNWVDYARSFGPRMFTRESAAAHPEFVTQLIDQLSERDGATMAQLWTSMAQQDLRPALPDMNLPVLVTYGEQSDAYKPETADYLVSTLPDATLRGFARSGHAPHIEEPEEFSRVVLEFAERVIATANQHNVTSGSIS